MTLATLHDEVREAILREIAAGTFKPNDKILSEREICELHGVSRTTARRAIYDLVNDGVLYTVSGKGTFVAERPLRQELRLLVGFTEDLRSQGQDVRTRVLALERVEANEDIALALGMRVQAPVTKLSRLRLLGDRPLAIQTSYLPEHRCPGLLHYDFAERSLFDTLRRDFNLTLVGGTTTIRAALANPAEAELLKLVPPASVLRTEQCTNLDSGEVIELCLSSFHGEKFELSSATGPQNGAQFTTVYSGERKH
ncbi:GntR family transcriptional regulator [Thalassorhabdomicrobium marinisediminis]|uniref:HTH gntR-type domain-containing protein n=1 Tax=Thalassorhabdomicrobium marinisediminis TaxID=2170577 RepID=A0A2T7FT61_9RHOB|nr:GntR family transcriptional regulator [Thalassorhabdomicrobium marinisediminis]PVA05360.1 hypothetical protein DC363_15185 [Thalassorhabdomicrobium marinisediminis]